MICVTPMRDEPVIAHEARRRGVVGARHQQEHVAWMRAELTATDAVAEDAPCLDLLAHASGLAPERYAIDHSLLASHILAAPAEQCHLYGSPAMVARTRQFGLRLPRKGAFACHACIDEDLKEKEFSWFRRTHQLVGVDRCPEHRLALQKIMTDQPFQQLPHSWREAGLTSEISLSKSSSTAETFIGQHVEISAALLRRDRPVPCEPLNQRLYERARALDVGSAKTMGQKLLSDRVLELAGDDWLVRHFPHFAMKAHGLEYREMENVLKRLGTAAPGESYVLALAALFESAEAALHLIALADIDAQTAGRLGE